MIAPLNEREARAVLERQRIGRLGCISNGFPYVVPVHYVMEGDYLYTHSLPGRKIEALRTNPRACLQADEIRDDYHWCSVIAFGTFAEITADDEREQIINKLFAPLPHFTPVESMIAQDGGLSSTIVFGIRIEEITGVGEGKISVGSAPRR